MTTPNQVRDESAPPQPDSDSPDREPTAQPASHNDVTPGLCWWRRALVLLDGRGGQAVTVVVLGVMLMVTGLSWVMASPVGGSPDDDYHLGSIWCPPPLSSSGCETVVFDGEPRIEVPATVAEAEPCYARNSDLSAACRLSLSDKDPGLTRRYDAGNYPYGYYQFHHLLVGDSVSRSVLLMRTVNLAIAVVLLCVVGALLPRAAGEAYLLAVAVSWVPMGIYFIASNNPSSWSLSGALTYGSGLYGSLHSQGRRRLALLALAGTGALLCWTSRGDAAFFVLVISLAVGMTAPLTKVSLLPGVAAAMASAVGVLVMRSTGQSGNVTSGDEAYPDLTTWNRAQLAVTSLLDYVGGFWGRRWGPGWFDVPLDGPVVIMALGLAGTALFIGARRMSVRKVLSVTVVLGAMLGVPVWVAIQNAWPYVYQYQPRYMLPLLAVFFMLWLLGSVRAGTFSRAQGVLLLGTSALAHSLALHVVLQRYTRGMGDFRFSIISNLNFMPQWWWPNLPVGPGTLWHLASVAYLLALLCALALTWPRRSQDLAPAEAQQ